MKRLIAATLAALVLGSAVVDAHKDKKHKGKKGKHEHHAVRVDDRDERDAVSVKIVWAPREVEVVRRHYGPKYRNLPPGLQKKYARTGQLPPGWRKKMQPFPADVERHCAPLPSGYHRGVIDAHAVIYNSRGMIIDVAVLF
jgi:Ni/Co efflux regulator RcnB